MKTIWKYSLTQPVTDLAVPLGAMILAIQERCGTPQIWMLVDPKAEQKIRTFRIYGTGHDVPDNPGNYCGTFQMNFGALVYHVFEVNSDVERLVCTAKSPMPPNAPGRWLHPDAKADPRNDPYYNYYDCPHCGLHFSVEVAE